MIGCYKDECMQDGGQTNLGEFPCMNGCCLEHARAETLERFGKEKERQARGRQRGKKKIKIRSNQ